MPEPWMIDELAYAGAEHLDAAFVAAFDQKQATDPSEDVEALLVRGLDASSTLVDLGAGTGTFALAIAPHCGRVIAVDVSPVMLDVLRRRAADADCSNITVVNAGFLSYEHEGPPADFVYTRHAVHQLPDFWKSLALERIAAILRPGGYLRLRDLIFDFQPHEAADMIKRWFEGALDDPARGYTRDDFAEHIRTEHSTYRWLLEPMLAATGFDIVDVEFRKQVYGAYTCIKR
jgi:ubiquinone/menaquinone biosynthesis C-methylase UbiE